MAFPITIAAVGDVAFAGPRADRPSPELFRAVLPCLTGADLAVANLESPLLENGKPIPGKCTLRGSPGWAAVLREAGIRLVTLANNHVMDYGEEGLSATLAALAAAGVRHVGAGKNRVEACAPVFLEVGSARLAVLARTSVIVSSPSHATEARGGVAFLHEGETLEQVRRCRTGADAVAVLLHWGIEEYQYPSVVQRRLAAKLIAAGADLVIGHHPHVLQGVEPLHGALVAYSLGNFVFDDFEWTLPRAGGGERRMVSRLAPENRLSMVLRIVLEGPAARTVRCVPVFTRIDETGAVALDESASRAALFEDRLCKRLGHPLYAPWWRAYALRREWKLRVGERLSPGRLARRIRKLRPRHARELWHTLVRSIRIVSGKSTNPYE
ncbi:MAG: CapA family protein [bacterium]